MRPVISLLCVSAFLFAAVSQAKDVYVSIDTGKNENAGTKAAPIKLLWKAIKAAQPGDSIHVAQGNYLGEGQTGCMPNIDKSDIKILGGYNADFSARDPFKFVSSVIAPEGSACVLPTKHTFSAERPDNNLSGVVIDGFVIDRGPLNTYKLPPKGDGSQDNSKSPNGATGIWLIGKGGFSARNNIILNSAYGGIYIKCGKDSDVKNNVVFSTVTRAISVIEGGGWGSPKITIENNTSAFSFKFRSTEGRGIYTAKGNAVYTIKNNVLAFNDESGVAQNFDQASTVLQNNLFFTNKYGDHVTGGQGGKKVLVANFGDELTGATGNVSEDPNLPINKEWLSKWFGRKDAAEGALTMDAVNQYRSAKGLPLQGGPGKSAELYAVRYTDWKDLLKIPGSNKYGAQAFH